MNFKRNFSTSLFFAIGICFLFFIAYTILGLVRQYHFWSGYDLAVVDQAIWKYAHFKAPISTAHAYAFTPILWDHVELIFPLLVPFYWIFDRVITLIVLQSFAICTSGLAVFLLARKYLLKTSVSLSLTVSYLLFYGIQNAVWADVHSLVFGVAFLAWFLYFCKANHLRLSLLFFFLTILCKEDMALLTLLISAIFFIQTKQKRHLFFMGFSLVYLFIVFYVYFPFFVPGGYRFQSKGGLLSHISPQTFYNTPDKRNVLWYSSLWFGFLPFLSPLALVPAFADLLKYFVVANSVVTSGQSLFGHYRSSLGILLVWPTILTIARYKKLNNMYVVFYILFFAFLVQFQLHLPISYLTKKWFWTTPQSVSSINKMISLIPPNTSVVTQVNILPHLSHRDLEFLLWPSTKDFKTNSPCGEKNCLWFRWDGTPQYMLVDTSSDWDVRYWLTDRTTFIQGLQNMEKAGIITPTKQIGTTTLYRVLKKP